MNTTIPSTRINHYAHVPANFKGGYLWGENEALDICCDECDANEVEYEAGTLRPEDFNLMVDMCRIDRYFKPCLLDDLDDLSIDTFNFIFRAWLRVARLAHTFWGIQSHFAALGLEPNEELAIDFVKRAVSALIKEENKAKDGAADSEKSRLAEMTA